GPLAKVESEHGLALGWAIVCKTFDPQSGKLEKYFDLQDHHVPDDVMLRTALAFAKNFRVSGEMHLLGPDGKKLAKGETVFLFPLTEQIAKDFEITTKRTGLMIGSLPSPDVLAKIKDGTYTGFSIGGWIKKGGLVEVPS